MSDVMRIEFQQDRKGMVWDLLLYIPTVAFLLTLAGNYWYGGDTNLAYLLLFLGSFFVFAGVNRVLKTRLMLLATAPVAIEVRNSEVLVTLRNGSTVALLKGLKYYSDYAGKSFGLTGLDGNAQRQQFVFHKGQFPTESAFTGLKDRLSRLG